MSVDQATVRRIAHLARIAVSEARFRICKARLNAILAFVAELDAVDVEGVEPMTSVIPMKLPMREDIVTDGEIEPPHPRQRAVVGRRVLPRAKGRGVTRRPPHQPQTEPHLTDLTALTLAEARDALKRGPSPASN